MTWLQNQTLYKKITHLLRACGDWIRKFGRLSPRDASVGGDGLVYSTDPGGDFIWVYDPHRQIWLRELRVSFRSLECRLRARETEAPPGFQAVRRILRNGP